MSRSLKAHILLVAVTFVWGATFVTIKNALADATPMTFNAVRMTLAAAALAVIFHREIPRITPPAFWAGSLVGALLWLGYGFQTPGLQYTSASKSAFLTGMAVVLVPLFLAIFWRRKINHWTLFGVAVAFIGLYLMTIPAGGNGLGDFASVNKGDLLTIASAVAFSLQIIFVGRATQHHPFSQIVLVQVTVCALLMIVSMPIIERPHIIFSEQVVWAILITGLLGTVAGFGVQGWAQQFTPPTHTALIFALEPVFAGLTSYVVLGERLGWRVGFGAGLILGGVLVSELMGHVQEPTAELIAEAGDD